LSKYSCIVLYPIGLPCVYFFVITCGYGITAVWFLMPLFYAILDFLLIRCYVKADWNLIK